MNPRFSARLIQLLFLGFSLSWLIGCGYKNAPIPPQSVVPTSIRDLLYETNEEGVRLSWSYPVRTISGTSLESIASFEMYLAEVALEDYCGTCPIAFGDPIEIDGGSPVDGTIQKKTEYQLSLLRPGYKYFVKVRSRTSWWADSEDSNILTFVWYQPATAPQEVQATPGDGQVNLSWQPVTTLTDGSKVTMAMQYQVLRSADGKAFQALREPVAANQFVDRQVRNGLQYFYTIQSMMVYQEELINGGISEPVAVTPIDLAPPASPLAVTVVETGVGIKIIWEKSAAADLGGYRVYRRAADMDKYELLGEVSVEDTLFVDKTAKKDLPYYYAITAIDQGKPANESDKSKEATLRY